MKGCLILGQTVYTEGTGTYQYNLAPNNELYVEPAYHLRRWDKDPRCGFNRVDNIGTQGQCLKQVGGTYMYGNVVDYDMADNTCVNPPCESCSLDGIIILALALVIYAVMLLRQRKN